MTAITVTYAGKNLYRNATSGADNPLITYVALGSSNTVPSPSDTVLGAEVFRKAVTSFVNGATGEIFVNLYLAPGDAIGDNIQEIGFFGGNSATSAANTGVLIAHGLYAHNPKTNLESIQFSLDFTFS